jgi:uncharacterized protein (UPF0264 family)
MLRFYIHHIHEGHGQDLQRIEAQLAVILGKLHNMSAELDRLTASVAAVQTQDDSIIALVQGLAQQIRDNATDPAALTALADSLDAESAKVAQAVTDNTTPTPAPPAP